MPAIFIGKTVNYAEWPQRDETASECSIQIYIFGKWKCWNNVSLWNINIFVFKTGLLLYFLLLVMVYCTKSH